MVSLKDRFRGLMVGIAVGDALGREVEGHRHVSASYLDEIKTRPRSITYSDDTAMAISLTESLLACDGFDGADMAQRFSKGYFKEPYRGYGSGVVDVFTRVAQGIDWRAAAGIQFQGSGSYGNGGAMRVAPVALFAYPNREATIRLAQDTAQVTHTHPLGVEGASIQALTAHHALRDEFDRDLLLEDLNRLVTTDEFRTRLEELPKAIDRDDDEYVRLHIGVWVAAHKSVLAATYSFLLAEDFQETIIRAIRLGGDTDTIAAMAGALAGARYGFNSIPKVWTRVEGFERMVELADAVFEGVGRGNEEASGPDYLET